MEITLFSSGSFSKVTFLSEFLSSIFFFTILSDYLYSASKASWSSSLEQQQDLLQKHSQGTLYLQSLIHKNHSSVKEDCTPKP